MIQVRQSGTFATTNNNILHHRRIIKRYLLEDDIKTFQTKDKNKNGQYEVRIPVFDIYHKIIGNGNGSERITISVYEIRCHPKDSTILKVLLAKCSEDLEKKIRFRPFQSRSDDI